MMNYFIAFIIIVVAVFIWDWFEETKQKDKKALQQRRNCPSTISGKTARNQSTFLGRKVRIGKIRKKTKALIGLDKRKKYVEIYYCFIA